MKNGPARKKMLKLITVRVKSASQSQFHGNKFSDVSAVRVMEIKTITNVFNMSKNASVLNKNSEMEN